MYANFLNDANYCLGNTPPIRTQALFSYTINRYIINDATQEDSPSGLWRTLGKRVGCKPSGFESPSSASYPGLFHESGVMFFMTYFRRRKLAQALVRRLQNLLFK